MAFHVRSELWRTRGFDQKTYHHETVVRLVLVLRRTLPLALLPFLVEEKAEVLVPGKKKKGMRVSQSAFSRSSEVKARHSREGRRRVLHA